MNIFDDFLIRALCAFGLMALMLAPLGSLALWRRMGYFGDAIAHASLLGVAISLAFGFSPIWGALVVALLSGLYLGTAGQTRSADGLLAVIAHGGLALALLITSWIPGGRGSLEGYLFGNILFISKSDLLWLSVLCAFVLAILIWRWQKMLYALLNEEMAVAAGIDPVFESRIFTLLLAGAVAIGIGLVGAFLIGAFLIIPAMAARVFARSPEGMTLTALLISCVSGVAGIALSWRYDTIAAPSMVAVLVIVYALTHFIDSYSRRTKG